MSYTPWSIKSASFIFRIARDTLADVKNVWHAKSKRNLTQTTVVLATSH